MINPVSTTDPTKWSHNGMVPGYAEDIQFGFPESSKIRNTESDKSMNEFSTQVIGNMSEYFNLNFLKYYLNLISRLV